MRYIKKGDEILRTNNDKTSIKWDSTTLVHQNKNNKRNLQQLKPRHPNITSSLYKFFKSRSKGRNTKSEFWCPSLDPHDANKKKNC